MGDLNCKKKERRCPSDNANGGILLEFCLEKNIAISSPVGFTNFPPVGRPSVLDIFLLKCGLIHSLPVSLNELSSNHNSVEMLVEIDFESIVNPTVFDYAKANWKNFKKDSNESIDLNFHIKTADEVEAKTDLFICLINSAINKNIPKKN